ncbi:GntR family transcriptional regulator [Amycolatopsis sp. K13G38]|uniref:GntR family transcriptional regulator n=1 Tax=Amycolatopsis acididurans TaxID=2724524 RepID=A0ABX1J6V3_9PSEU|nr:GntR family transcriptional regulator [Amycolatopsis acididurans]NKQ55521.1 GntR family transcriptional regulator [Amycolatopsis acididurans]
MNTGRPAQWTGAGCLAPVESHTHRRQLPEEAASYARELIISGAVRPGEFLRLEGIAQAVGISNTPVREGLLTLRSEGFVQLVPRRGFVVAPFTPQDVRDLFWAQARLAGELASRAAQVITGEQLARLDANLEEYERANEAGDRGKLAMLGHQFHREVNLAAGSHRLTLVLGSIVKQFPNRFYAGIEGQVAATRDEHPLILDALRRRQPRQARAIMEDHIAERAESLTVLLADRGLW